MNEFNLAIGDGRTKVSLRSYGIGDDIAVFIYNRNAHIGSVAVGEYDFKSERASVSLITRLGHKDDAIARRAAYLISKATQKPVCVIAGVHIENITDEEITEIVAKTESAIIELIDHIKTI